jgi:hypothetical protein
VIVVQLAAIPHQRPVLRRRDDLPERVHSILQRHDTGQPNRKTKNKIEIKELCNLWLKT